MRTEPTPPEACSMDYSGKRIGVVLSIHRRTVAANLLLFPHQGVRLVDAVLGPKWECVVTWVDEQGQPWGQAWSGRHMVRGKRHEAIKQHFLSRVHAYWSAENNPGEFSVGKDWPSPVRRVHLGLPRQILRLAN